MTTTYVPNTTVTVLDTGTVETAAGDEIENSVTVTANLPAVWSQRSSRIWNPATGRSSLIRYVRVTLRPGTVVKEGQRLRNDRTGELGTVDAVDTPQATGTARNVTVLLTDIRR
jgi:hypothetical protein